MGKNKLKKFDEMRGFECVFQYPWARLQTESFPLRGEWRKLFFRNDSPIILELGCGRGEYTVGLAKDNPEANHIGIDVKGARIWAGAKEATLCEMKNVAFIRGEIEQIESFFAPGEVDELWITFPDPQMQKTRRRLTSARFLNMYRNILKPGGTVHLKTDSPFLYTFTKRLVETNHLPLLSDFSDLYAEDKKNHATAIQTYYEMQWLSRGKSIKLLEFNLPSEGEISDPSEEDIPNDDYTSYPRGIAQCMPDQLAKLKL